MKHHSAQHLSRSAADLNKNFGIEEMYNAEKFHFFGIPNYTPMVHPFDYNKAVQAKKPIIKGGKPAVKALKRGSYLDFLKQNFKLYPKSKVYDVRNTMPNPKPAKKDVRNIKPTKRDTFIDKIFNENKKKKVYFFMIVPWGSYV